MKRKLSKSASYMFFALLSLSFSIPGAITQPGGQEHHETTGKKNFPAAKHYTVKKAVSKIKIDGVLNEESWRHAEKRNVLYEWMPGDNIPSPVESYCLVTFDNSRLYIAFKCLDPEPQKIRAHLMDRDCTTTFVQDDHGIGDRLETDFKRIHFCFSVFSRKFVIISSVV